MHSVCFDKSSLLAERLNKTCLLSLVAIHRVKCRNSNLWPQYDLYSVGQNGVLCEVVEVCYVARIKLNHLV